MEELTNTIVNGILNSDVLGLIALISGLIYVILAANGSRLCWIAGIISCSIIAWQDVMDYKLYADAGLQIFYVIVGVIGWYKWNSQSNNQLVDLYEFSLFQHIKLIVGEIFISLILWALLTYLSDAAMPFLDSLTSVFAVGATIMLLYKIPSNWIYWIVIDACYIYIYQRQGADYFAFLSVIYLVLAIYGYVKWRKK